MPGTLKQKDVTERQNRNFIDMVRSGMSPCYARISLG